jgi:T4 RnlA family RNA ligase
MLPTLEECNLIVASNSTFKRKEEVIEGRKVVQFSYLLAKHNDFIKPLGDIEESYLTAEELRGITFVEQEDGSFKRFLMLPKFFNLNQTTGSMYDDVKDLEVETVQDKLDGSMITFIPINGVILPKTKFSFFNDQAKMASDIYYSDTNVRTLVDNCLEIGYYPIFELVSPQNRIVLPYSKTELRLLQIRRSDGSFKPLYDGFQYAYPNIVITPKEEHTIDNLVELANILEWKEGWVVTFTNGHMIKIKTKHYFEQHQLMTGDINVEHKIIEMTLNETIDDVLSQMPEDAIELRNFVNVISDGIAEYVDNRVNNIFNAFTNVTVNLINNQYPFDKKLFVDEVRANAEQYFKEMMYVYDKGPDIELIEKYVIEDTIKKTNALEKARKFLKDLGIETKHKPVIED